MNPLTGTHATDDDCVVERTTRALSIYAKNIGPLRGLEVEVNEEGVLYTHIGKNVQIAPGTIIVMTRGETDGLPDAIVYGDLLKADRGQIYAEDYYIGEIPALRMDRNHMLWALDVLHRDDLTDPETVKRRNAKLERVRARLAKSTSPRKLRAAQHAERGQRVTDKRKRPNPMATAMVTWAGTVQLNRQLRVALQANLRVSKSRAAIVRLLGATWKVFHDADIELASMERWWDGNRKRPLSFAQAKRLSVRASNVWGELDAVHAAPFAGMPLYTLLKNEVSEFATALADGTRFRTANKYLIAARRLLAYLFVHQQVSQMLVTAGRVHRVRRAIGKKERLAYVRAADEACGMADIQVVRGLGNAFLRRLRGRLADAKQVGLEDSFDAELACYRLNQVLGLYLEP